MLVFKDYEGICLFFVVDNGEKGVRVGVLWKCEDILLEYVIIGLGLVMLMVVMSELIVDVLINIMGFCYVGFYLFFVGDYRDILVYVIGEGGSGVEVYIEMRFDLLKVCLGCGGVYYVVFCVLNEEEYNKWVV